MSNLGTTLHSTVDPTTPSIGPVSTGEEDVSMWFLQSLEVPASQLWRSEEPSPIRELVLIPVVCDLGQHWLGQAQLLGSGEKEEVSK